MPCWSWPWPLFVGADDRRKERKENDVANEEVDVGRDDVSADTSRARAPMLFRAGVKVLFMGAQINAAQG